MEQIDPIHVSEPGLLVLDITGQDEATVHAAVEELGRRWATSVTPSVRRVPGEPGVAARLHADLRPQQRRPRLRGSPAHLHGRLGPPLPSGCTSPPRMPGGASCRVSPPMTCRSSVTCWFSVVSPRCHPRSVSDRCHFLGGTMSLWLSHRARGLHASSDRAPMSFPRRAGLYA
ncbi:DUF6207 family protein [Streptomyces sp. NPDC058290]|uniref:DUF6207 family protein n=1 Tax=Streptomyces sp. NPDC058290 TaxID=3346426 RepID=UPI0036EE2171